MLQKKNSVMTGLITLLVCCLFITSACTKKYVDKITFDFSPDLEAARVMLVFTKEVQTDFVGSFNIKDYGSLFLIPYESPKKPFKLGFDLKMDVVNDQEYIRLTPVERLPNGMPHGVTYPIVQVNLQAPVHKEFDLFTYVDVLKQKWLGVAVMFNELDEKVFPKGLTLSQVFLRDNEGTPSVIAHLFGQGKKKSEYNTGGIALLVNAYYMICNMESRPEFCNTAVKAKSAPLFTGTKISLKSDDKFYKNGNLNRPISVDEIKKYSHYLDKFFSFIKARKVNNSDEFDNYIGY